jgi:hypothetical protein
LVALSRTILVNQGNGEKLSYVEAERHEARQGDDATVDEVVLVRSISRAV